MFLPVAVSTKILYDIMHTSQLSYDNHILSMDKEGKLRAAEWALKRQYGGKSKLSPYQRRKIEKDISLANNTVEKKGPKVPKISAKDLAELEKNITAN